MLLRKLFQWTCHYSKSLKASVPEQADSHTRQQREALLRSRRRRHGGAVDLASTRSVQDATASLAQALHAGDGAIHAAARELRRSVSGGGSQCHINSGSCWDFALTASHHTQSQGRSRWMSRRWRRQPCPSS